MFSVRKLVSIKKNEPFFTQNWAIGSSSNILDDIQLQHVNIAIYNRDIDLLKPEINSLKQQDVSVDANGTIGSLTDSIQQGTPLNKDSLILEDIRKLLKLFKEMTNRTEFRLFLATVNSNMCRRFHMDRNSLRMLCTYSGPGTLWLSEDNVNRAALNAYHDNTAVVIDKQRVNQVGTGSIVVLKGAHYSRHSDKGIVHRSPTIEETGERRLLLRIDPI